MAVRKIRALIDSYDGGVILREGVLAIICGKPNVGKSSLMNLLLKRDRVIVSSVPGTTRDAIEETINLGGIPVRLVDTAGITKTEDIVEKEGVQRSRRYLELADIALFMLDASAKIDRSDLDIAAALGDKKKLVILNKTDKFGKTKISDLKRHFKDDRMIAVSVKTGKNIKLLEKDIYDMIRAGGFVQGEGTIVSNARHKDSLDRALRNMLSVDRAFKKDLPPELVAVDLREAINSLGLIVGKTVSEDVLDRIFEKFCIGK
jgi:tRNA modification GTPase